MGEYHIVSASTTLPVHKDSSHTMSKMPPKIKIIHIIAPEIIKTDVANFRDLVQRLTGKPAASTVDVAPPPPAAVEGEQKKEAIKKRPAPAPAAERGELMVLQENNKKRIKCEVKVEEGGLGDGLDHNELWMDLNPGGFLSFLEEDVLQGMAPDFLQPLGSSRMDLVGEMYAS